MIDRLRNEAGYSLVEVMASIMIMAIAIIPMVGMFDMGLNTATRSGNYDTARAFANTKLEQAKSLPYAQVRDNFPQSGDTTPTSGSPASRSTEPEVPSDFPEVPSNFRYSTSKRYLTPPAPNTTSTSATLSGGSTTDTGIIEVSVTVGWGDNNSYSATGVVARGTL